MIADYFHKMRRGPQIINQKDIGLILSFTGVSDGWRVIEGGSGSGALTMYLANSVKPSGRVFSYDWRPEHQEVAVFNINKAGLNNNVEFIQADIYEQDFKQKDADLVTLDVAEPWKAFKSAKESLKKDGHLVVYIPTFEQLKKSIRVLNKNKFHITKVVDSMLREYKTEETSTRPENMGLMFTAFLIFARKT